MYGYIISNYRIIVDTNIWMNYTIITYLYIIPNKNIWLDNGILPYFSSIRDHCGSGTERIKMLCKFIKISKRIVGYQKGLALWTLYFFVYRSEERRVGKECSFRRSGS